MVDLPGDEHLKEDERWARRLLEGTVGQTRVTDRKGGPEGHHDLEAILPDSRIAAIEITSEADQARLSVAAAARRHLSTVTVPGSQFAWLVTVTPQALGRAGRSRQWCDQGRTGWRGAGWWRTRRVGVACRGGIVTVATATLICACRDRRSVL